MPAAPPGQRPDCDLRWSDTERLGDLKRHLILDAAREVFLRNGFAGSRMDQVAVQAGISKSTLYHHFDGRDALFETLVDREAARLACQLPALDRTEAEPAIALRRLARSVMDAAVAPDTLAVFRLIVGSHGSFPAMGERFLQAALDRFVEQLTDYLDARVGVDDLRTTSARVSASRFARRCLAQGLERLLVSEPYAHAADRDVRAAQITDDIIAYASDAPAPAPTEAGAHPPPKPGAECDGRIQDE